LARIILSHALLESIRFVMSRKECRDIYGLINMHRKSLAISTANAVSFPSKPSASVPARRVKHHVPSATPGASSTGEPTITPTAITRSPVTRKSEMRSTLTFNSKSPAIRPGFQGEVRKRHLSIPPFKRALRPPPGSLSGSL
jgi:hypothetical protein